MPELFQKQTKEGYVEMIQNYRELLWEIKENLKQSGKITKSCGFPLDNLTLPCLLTLPQPSRIALPLLQAYFNSCSWERQDVPQHMPL